LKALSKKPEEILDFAESVIFEIAKNNNQAKAGFRKIDDLLGEAVDKIEELFKTKQTVTGVSTGFTDLDKQTSGLQGGDLVVVAGRPSMGKTSFSMNLIEYAAINQDAQLATRMLASLSRVNSTRLRTGQLENDDWPKLTSAIGLLNQKNIYIDDTPALSPLEVRTRARRLAGEHEHGLGMIMLDYLQLMRGNDTGGTENRTLEISNITRSLKGLAKELDCPIIILSQLNRSLEQRPNKRPVMSDLRESGAIEQDADLIMFIYRHEVYEPETEQKGLAEIIIGKQRNGPIGTVRLAFLGEFTRFENYAHSGSFSDE